MRPRACYFSNRMRKTYGYTPLKPHPNYDISPESIEETVSRQTCKEVKIILIVGWLL